ncbi:MAG: hypothetical protein HOL85_14540 [Rhodospirillaceae bacterium]|nr:hypothetical protein [Rhodospirillaceae bacterium]MBT6139505.1 hypothetical protein [Rhodospirillaceae bacterium]
MIVAPAEFLARGARSARLNPNAVVVDHSEGELVFPSFFCRSPSPWMKAMAWLAMRNIEFRIYMLEFDLKPKEVERSRLGVYPRVSDDLLELMREIDAREVDWLETMHDKIDWALARLRETSLAAGTLHSDGTVVDNSDEVG